MRALFLLGSVCAALTFGSVAARADVGFDGRTWQPTHDPNAWMALSSSGVLEKQWLQFSLGFDYARNPIVLSAGNAQLAPVVTDASTLELGAAMGLGRGWQLGLAFPIGFHSYQNPVGVDRQRGADNSGIGDLRAGVKFQPLAPNGFTPGVALAADVSLGTGNGNSWYGSGTTQPAFHVVLDENVGEYLSLTGNLGYRIHPEDVDVWGTSVGDALLYGAGLRINTGFEELSIGGEIVGSVDTTSGPTPAEAGIVISKKFPAENIRLSIGANAGLTSSLGTPAFRTYALFSWQLQTVKPPPPIIDENDNQNIIEIPVEPEPPPPQPEPEVKKEPAPVSKEPEVEKTPEPPPEPAKVVVVRRERIDLPQRIEFELGKAKLTQESKPVLDAVALAMLEHPEILLVRIDGHTDSSGTAVFNQLLSLRRALSVRKYLAGRGVEMFRMEVKGFGEAKPIKPNDSPANRAQNRRVEFNILNRADEPDTPDTPETPEETPP